MVPLTSSLCIWISNQHDKTVIGIYGKHVKSSIVLSSFQRILISQLFDFAKGTFLEVQLISRSKTDSNIKFWNKQNQVYQKLFFFKLHFFLFAFIKISFPTERMENLETPQNCIQGTSPGGIQKTKATAREHIGTKHCLKQQLQILFSNFSCMFLNPNHFFRFEL